MQTRAWFFTAAAALWLATTAPAQLKPEADDVVTVAPIPISPKATLQRDQRAATLLWKRRVMLEAFRSSLKGNPWDQQALRFVEKAIDGEKEDDDYRRPELIAEGKAVIDAGCDDPLLLWLWAQREIEFTTDWRKVVETYDDKIWKTIEASRYPRAVCYWIGVDYRGVRVKGQHDTVPIDKRTAKWIGESFTDGSYKEEETPLLVEQVLRSGLLDNAVDLIGPVIDAAVLPEWAKLTLVGELEIKRAWAARGGSWASKVKPEGWEGFGAHLAKANAALTKAWKLRPDQPFAAASMITVVGGGGAQSDETERVWFDRAVQARFDYKPAYDNLTWFQLPRWGGTHEQMLAFGQACAATKRYDTYVPIVLLDALFAIMGDTGDWKSIHRVPEIARDVITVSEGVAASPQRRDHETRKQMLALNSWMAGDYQRAARALAEAKGEFQPLVQEKMRRNGINEAVFRSETAVLGGPAREDYEAAESAFAALDVDKAEKLYLSAAQKAGNTVAPPFLIARRLAGIKFERELARGGWVNVAPDMGSWQTIKGDWSVTPDGALVIKGGDTEGAIFAPGRAGEDFEIRGDFEVIAPRKCCRNLGVIVGYRATSPPQDWITCLAWQRGSGRQEAQVSTGWSNGKDERETKAFNHEGKGSFVVQAWQGKVNYYLNGKPVATGFEPAQDQVRPIGLDMDGMFGFGAGNFCRNNTTYIRNVKIRRLTTAPTAPGRETL